MTEGAGDRRRRYPVAVSAEALALAWARQEDAPAGSVIVVDHEISPRGRLGRLWPHPAERTAVLAMVWRPAVAASAADLVWAAASLGLLRAVQALGEGDGPALWWPDEVHDGGGRLLGAVRAEVQLGPGRVTSAVVTGRIDLDHAGGYSREDVLVEVEGEMAAVAAVLDRDPDALRAACYERSALAGRRAVAHLLPKGEVRGEVAGVDPDGGLVLRSATGLRQRVSILGLDRVSIS